MPYVNIRVTPDGLTAEKKAELIRGGGGIFNVEVDGKLIFSKQQTGRFPEEQEILDQLPD